MRIIGGHDYYDSALAYGRDDDLLFVRDTREIDKDETPLEWPNGDIFARSEYHYDRRYHTVNNEVRYYRPLIAYVCGVRYFGIEFYNSNYKDVIWSYEKLTEYAAQHKLKILDNSKWSWRPEPSLKDRWNMKTTKEQLDWLIANRVAIAVGGFVVDDTPKSPHVWYCNDAKVHSLRSLHFQKVMDPFTLFQELSMFVGNLPQPGPSMVQITDPAIKIAKHGFDKWSFRKHRDDPK